MGIEEFSTVTNSSPAPVLPEGGRTGTWAGRVWLPDAFAPDGVAGPRVVTVANGCLHDVSAVFPTFTDLLNASDRVEGVRRAVRPDRNLGTVDEFASRSIFSRRAARLETETEPVLLAPNDLPATRACGVTFIRSLLERVIEEKAKGDPQKAADVRRIILESLGEDLSRVRPGSPETVVLKERLIAEGVWSQYLEVGIGPDAEIFTKAQAMASVGYGAQIGIHPKSRWSNPEPEIVLAVSSEGAIAGAALGNDVNLRDFEGRSALLLGEAKDQNGSCAIGPFVRLFDDTFSLGEIEACEVELTITGEDGFVVSGRNRMAEISRRPADLVGQAIGENHQYPDGLMLFLGTMFAPTEDRENPGEGFTHHRGDRVEIASEPLGRLVNWVNTSDAIPRWTYGARKLAAFLARSHPTPGVSGAIPEERRKVRSDRGLP